MAITSDTVPAASRRRSRSWSGLPDAANVAAAQGRRRSDEIRFWRESYGPGLTSPLSSNAHEDMDGDNEDTGVHDVSLPESPAAERPPKTPPQPFNFNAITNEMIGMKITQAASIESRIGSLETRMLSLERLLEQLCRSLPGVGFNDHDAPLAGHGLERPRPPASPQAPRAFRPPTPRARCRRCCR